MFVADYVAKFEELSRYCLHYNGVDVEGSKCVKFKNVLHLKIKQFIGYQEICCFLVLVNKCVIYDEDNRVRSTRYKSVSEKKFSNQNRSKLYANPSVKGNQKAATRKGISGGDILFTPTYFRRGKAGHRVSECKNTALTYFICGEQCRISTYCQNPKKEQCVGQNGQTKGKVFALSGVEVSKSDNLIQGMCFGNGIPLIYIIDTGTTHSFISHNCVIKLNFVVSHMKGIMVIDIPTNGFVTTSLVCLNCPLSIYGKYFGLDFICLPLSLLDVILRMNW